MLRKLLNYSFQDINKFLNVFFLLLYIHYYTGVFEIKINFFEKSNLQKKYRRYILLSLNKSFFFSCKNESIVLEIGRQIKHLRQEFQKLVHPKQSETLLIQLTYILHALSMVTTAGNTIRQRLLPITWI